MSRKRRTTISHSITFSEGYNKFILHCQAKNLRDNTIDTYKQHLAMFQDYLDRPVLEDVTTDTLRGYIVETMDTGVADATIASRVRTLRVFFNFLTREKVLQDNPTENLDKIRVDDTGLFVLSAKQVKKLLQQPDQSQFAGFRDYVIMSTMLDTGVRIGELLVLLIKNITPNYIVIEKSKNRKQRILPMGKQLQELMQQYLKIRKGRPHEFLFCNVMDEQLARRTLQDRITTYGKRARINNVRVSPHTLRHTFATQYLLNGGDMVSLQEILGHSSLEMVRRYVNYLQEDIQVQHKKFSPLDRL